MQEGARAAARADGICRWRGAELRLDDQGPSDAAPADPHAADWMRNVLHAREMRLDAFAAELGRYRPGLLRCDPAVAPLRVSGAFQLHDTDAVLAALPATLPVSVRYRTSYWSRSGRASRRPESPLLQKVRAMLSDSSCSRVMEGRGR